MTQNQTAINARATRWLGDLLEQRGVPDGHGLAEHVTRELLAQGLAPVPKPVPIRAATPAASPEIRAAALEKIRADIEHARRVRQEATR